MINKTPQKTYTLNNSQFYNNMLNKQRNSIYKIDSCDYAKYYQAKRQKQLHKLLDIIEKALFATGAIALTYLCIPKGKIFEKLFSTLAKTTSDTESKAYKLYVRLCNFISKEKYEPSFLLRVTFA